MGDGTGMRFAGRYLLHDGHFRDESGTFCWTPATDGFLTATVRGKAGSDVRGGVSISPGVPDHHPVPWTFLTWAGSVRQDFYKSETVTIPVEGGREQTVTWSWALPGTEALGIHLTWTGMRPPSD